MGRKYIDCEPRKLRRHRGFVEVGDEWLRCSSVTRVCPAGEIDGVTLTSLWTGGVRLELVAGSVEEWVRVLTSRW